MKPSVVAIVATYRRAPQLAVLLRSLAETGPLLAGVIVVDNAGDPATAEALAASPLTTHRLLPERNLGCGGGLAFAENSALSLFPDLTHLWAIDDDVRVEPDVLPKLLKAMEAENAIVASPFVVDHRGLVGWFPGLRAAAQFNAVRRDITPADFITRFGPAPVAFTWCTGVALLLTRAAFERAGPHRSDYWIRGEDLEFSLRLTAFGRGILVPSAIVHHFPPDSEESDPKGQLEKHTVLLQNVAYTSTRVPHGRSLLPTLPGNLWKFLKQWGLSARTLTVALQAYWRGAILGEPAGKRRRD